MKCKLFKQIGCILFASFVLSSCNHLWIVSTSGVEPNIRVGDRVFVLATDHYTYGDVIVFEIRREEDVIGNVQEGKKEYRRSVVIFNRIEKTISNKQYSISAYWSA